MLCWIGAVPGSGISFVPQFKGGRAAGGVKGWKSGCGLGGLVAVLITSTTTRCRLDPIGKLWTECRLEETAVGAR